MQRRHIVISLGVLLVAVLGGVVAMLSPHAPAAPVKPTTTVRPAAVISVTLAQADLQRLHETQTVTGSISAWDQLTIGAEANGLRIREVTVDEGSYVAKGQPLATLNSEVLQAQLRQAEARLVASQATANKAVQPNRPQDIAGLQASLAQANANLQQEQANLIAARSTLTNAELNVSRYSNLQGQGYVTRQEAENRQTDVEKARASEAAQEDRVRAARFAVDQAQQRLSLAQAGGRAEDVQIAQAAIAEIEGTIQQLHAQLAQTVITAPDDGLIIKRDAHIGDISSAGKTLFTMVRRNQLELRAQIPENSLSGIHVGQPVTISRDGKTIQGKVYQITPTIDPTTRLGTVRISVPMKGGFMPGMFVRADIETGSPQVLAVPNVAVLTQDNESYIFTYAHGRAHRRDITTGLRTADRVEIRKGLKPGDKVIVAGAGFLADGDAVDVKATP